MRQIIITPNAANIVAIYPRRCSRTPNDSRTTILSSDRATPSNQVARFLNPPVKRSPIVALHDSIVYRIVVGASMSVSTIDL